MPLEVQMPPQVSVPHPTEGRQGFLIPIPTLRRRALQARTRFVVAQFIAPLILTCR